MKNKNLKHGILTFAVLLVLTVCLIPLFSLNTSAEETKEVKKFNVDTVNELREALAYEGEAEITILTNGWIINDIIYETAPGDSVPFETFEVYGKKSLNMMGATISITDRSNCNYNDWTDNFTASFESHNTLFHINKGADLTIWSSYRDAAILFDGYMIDEDYPYKGVTTRDLFLIDGNLTIKAGTFVAGRLKEQGDLYQAIGGTPFVMGDESARLNICTSDVRVEWVDVWGGELVKSNGHYVSIWECPEFCAKGIGTFFSNESDHSGTKIWEGKFLHERYDRIRQPMSSSGSSLKILPDDPIQFNIPYLAEEYGEQFVVTLNKEFVYNGNPKRDFILDSPKSSGVKSICVHYGEVYDRNTGDWILHGAEIDLGTFKLGSAGLDAIYFSIAGLGSDYDYYAQIPSCISNYAIEGYIALKQNGKSGYLAENPLSFNDLRLTPADYITEPGSYTVYARQRVTDPEGHGTAWDTFIVYTFEVIEGDSDIDSLTQYTASTMEELDALLKRGEPMYIILRDDITIERELTVSSEVAINLQNYDLTFSVAPLNYAINVTEEGSLTIAGSGDLICDNSCGIKVDGQLSLELYGDVWNWIDGVGFCVAHAHKNGSVTVNNGNYSDLTFENDSKLTINGGSFDGVDFDSHYNAYTEINGGSFDETNFKISNYGTITINNGDFSNLNVQTSNNATTYFYGGHYNAVEMSQDGNGHNLFHPNTFAINTETGVIYSDCVKAMVEEDSVYIFSLGFNRNPQEYEIEEGNEEEIMLTLGSEFISNFGFLPLPDALTELGYSIARVYVLQDGSSKIIAGNIWDTNAAFLQFQYTFDKPDTYTYTEAIILLDKNGDEVARTEDLTTINVPKVLTSISITTSPNKTTYAEGEDFDPTGMVVTAYFSDGTSEIITDYEIIDGEDLPRGQEYINISYTLGGVTATAKRMILISREISGAGFELDAYYSGVSFDAILTNLNPDKYSPNVTFADIPDNIVLKNSNGTVLEYNDLLVAGEEYTLIIYVSANTFSEYMLQSGLEIWDFELNGEYPDYIEEYKDNFDRPYYELHFDLGECPERKVVDQLDFYFDEFVIGDDIGDMDIYDIDDDGHVDILDFDVYRKDVNGNYIPATGDITGADTIYFVIKVREKFGYDVVFDTLEQYKNVTLHTDYAEHTNPTSAAIIPGSDYRTTYEFTFTLGASRLYIDFDVPCDHSEYPVVNLYRWSETNGTYIIDWPYMTVDDDCSGGYDLGFYQLTPGNYFLEAIVDGHKVYTTEITVVEINSNYDKATYHKINFIHDCKPETLEHYDAQNPTCSDCGWIECYECDCGQFYLDAEATQPADWETEVMIPIVEHDFSLESYVYEYEGEEYEYEYIAYVAHNCLESDIIGYICKYCQKSVIECVEMTTEEYLASEYVFAGKQGDHNMADVLTNDGTSHYYACLTEGCDHKESVEACAGGFVTCTDLAVCDVCEKTYGELLPHNYSELYPQDTPHCLNSGMLAHYRCSECEGFFDENKNPKSEAELTIPAVGHYLVTLIPEIPATCTEDGLKAHYQCTFCNGYFDTEKNATDLDALKIVATGHTYGDLIAEIPATEEAEGTKAHKDCVVCLKHFDTDGNEIVDLTIPKLDPTPDPTPDPDPTDDGLGAGAIVAIVLGSVAVLGGGGFAIFWFVVKKKSFSELLVIFERAFSSIKETLFSLMKNIKEMLQGLKKK